MKVKILCSCPGCGCDVIDYGDVVVCCNPECDEDVDILLTDKREDVEEQNDYDIFYKEKEQDE